MLVVNVVAFFESAAGADGRLLAVRCRDNAQGREVARVLRGRRQVAVVAGLGLELQAAATVEVAEADEVLRAAQMMFTPLGRRRARARQRVAHDQAQFTRL